VDSPLAPVHLQPVSASPEPGDLADADVVLFCPKLWDVKAAAAQLQPALAAHTLVIPFQNGVESPGWVADVVGPSRVAIGVAQIASTIGSPGVIAHTGSFARMRVGLVPDFAAMYSLPRVVGVQRARELMLSAREVQAEEALRLGLAMELVPEDGLLARAQELARSFTGASPLAVSLVKAEVGMALATDVRTTLANEADHQALCFETDEHQAAVRRFLDKEPAAFQFPARRG
jgi:ketopantoate reductase